MHTYPLRSPNWITSTFGITAIALRDLNLRDAEDPEIFEAAKSQAVIFMTKDSDFVDLVDRLEAPPQIIWLTCQGLASRSSVNKRLTGGQDAHPTSNLIFCGTGILPVF